MDGVVVPVINMTSFPGRLRSLPRRIRSRWDDQKTLILFAAVSTCRCITFIIAFR